MHTFFHGWRRKAGVITLAMACVVTCGWLRGRTHIDVVDYSMRFTTVSITSSRRGVMWESDTRPSEYPNEASGFQYNVYEEHGWYEPHFLQIEGHVFGFAGFLFYWRETTADVVGGTLVNAPYWSIAVPLTLLSAYLIIWKPRKRV
ncbi:MAG: hypothetical protein JWP89_5661 [Schlesneria sp.]|nr:hypothetical protein [Schlesneria sp.]